MKDGAWRFVIAALAVALIAGCQVGGDNPRDCALLNEHAKVEDLRHEHGGWRFTASDTVYGGLTGDVWVEGEQVTFIEYGDDHCPEQEQNDE